MDSRFQMSLLFNESFRKIEFLFKLAGIKLDHKIQNTARDIIKYRWFYIINFLWLNTDFIGELLWLIQGIVNGKKIIELTYIAPCITGCLLANSKGLLLVLNGDKLIELFKNLRNLEEIESDNEDKDKIIKEVKSFLMVFLSALNVGCVVTVTSLCFVPFIVMAMEYKMTGKIELMLPFQAVYPIDPFDMKYWPFVYLHQCWSSVIVLLNLGGADCLFYICCTSICTQFRLLQHDIEALIPERAFDEGVFQNKFKKLLTRHQDIIRSVNLLEMIYSKATLFNFVTSSFLICLTGFNVTVIEDVAFMLTFLSFLLASSLQISLFCFFGDMLMTSSMQVSNAIYDSKWYTLNAKTAKNLFLVQMRAQKPCKLTAAGYADVTLRAFTKIFSTAWSYFALLKTIHGRSPFYIEK